MNSPRRFFDVFDDDDDAWVVGVCEARGEAEQRQLGLCRCRSRRERCTCRLFRS